MDFDEIEIIQVFEMKKKITIILLSKLTHFKCIRNPYNIHGTLVIDLKYYKIYKKTRQIDRKSGRMFAVENNTIYKINLLRNFMTCNEIRNS